MQNHARIAIEKGVDLTTMPPHAYYTEEGYENIELLLGSNEEWVNFVNKKMLNSDFVYIWFLIQDIIGNRKVIGVLYDKNSNYPSAISCNLEDVAEAVNIQSLDIMDLFPDLLHGYNHITYH